MWFSMSRSLVAGGLSLSFLLGIATASLIDRSMTKPEPAEASVQQPQATCPLSSNLPYSMDGSWYREGNSNNPAVVGINASIDLINEFGSRARAHLACDGTVIRIIVDESVSPGRSGNSWQAGITGTVLNPNGDGVNYSIIRWDNGSSWSR